MRAPVLVGFGGSRPSKQGLSYLSDAGATPEAFGAGIGRALGGLGESITEAGLKYEQRNDKTERFGGLIGLSEFHTQTANALTELQRGVPPNVTDFPKQANDLYTQREQAFISSLPPRLQPEFTFRARQIKQGIMAQAFEFQYTQQDAFFTEGIAKEYERARNAIYATPAEAEKWHRHMDEVINESGLTDIAKEEWRVKVGGGLLAVEYGRDYERAKRESATVGGDIVDRIIQVESGGDPNASPSTSRALGLGQFIPSTWKAFIADRHPNLLAQGDDIQKLRTDPVLGREAVEWYIGQNKAVLEQSGLPVTAGNIYLAHFLGPGGAKTLLSAGGDTPVSAILGADQIAANKSILQGKTVSQVIAWAQKKMGETAVTQVDVDPKYADIPLEDRLAIQADANRKVDQEVADAVAAANAAAQAARNAAYVGFHDGTMGRAELQALRNNGTFSDINDIQKAEGIIAKREAEFADQKYIDGLLAVGTGYSTEDNGRLNNWFSQSMRQGVAAGNQEIMNSRILPAINTLHDVPTDLVAQLSTMIRSTNPDLTSFALDTLAQIKRLEPKAFDARTDDALAGDVKFWQDRKDLMPRDQILQQINGGFLPEERQRRQQLEQEARTILSTKTNTVPHGQELVAGIVNSYDQSFKNDPQMPGLPWAARGVNADFETFFTDGYIKYGTEEEAVRYAEEGLARIYGVTTIGNSGQVFMKLPPDKAGYRMTAGSYDWIDKQVRKEMSLGEEDEFQLVTDEATIKEFHEWQRDSSALPASYLVAVKRDGVWEIEQDVRGLPVRKYFVQGEEEKTQDAELFVKENQRKIMTDELMTLSAQRDMMVLNGQEVPDEMTKRIDFLTSGLEDAQ